MCELTAVFMQLLGRQRLKVTKNDLSEGVATLFYSAALTDVSSHGKQVHMLAGMLSRSALSK
jgi:hypothetical protein